MDRAGGVLVGIGLLLIVVAIRYGGLSPGWVFEVPMVLLRVGIVFTVLGGATVSLRSISVENAVVVSIITLSVVFVVGVAAMYYAFETTTPEIESPLTVSRLVVTQVSVTMVLAPIPAGYVAGVLEGRGRPSIAYRTFIVTTIAAWIIATFLFLVVGEAAGLVGGVILMFTIATAGIALLPRHFLRRTTSREFRR